MPMLPYTATTLSQHLVPRDSESPAVPSKFHKLWTKFPPLLITDISYLLYSHLILLRIALILGLKATFLLLVYILHWEKALTYKGPALWNNLPYDLQMFQYTTTFYCETLC